MARLMETSINVKFSEALAETIKELGLSSLKPKQVEAIQAFVNGNDVFVSLPTGYGKSLIYGILPLIYNKLRGCNDSIVVCISPLISIMINQRERFQSVGINSEYVGETQEDSDAIKRVLNGCLHLLFISPESILMNLKYRSMLRSVKYKNKLVALAVDEAHCIKTWGDDFRVAFSQLGELRSIVPDNVGILALTATATPETLKAVTSRLSLKDPVVIGLPHSQNNLKYHVEPLPSLNLLSDTLVDGLLNKRTAFPKSLIFCNSVSDCALLYEELRSRLGLNFTEPPGYPNYHRFRLVDMYVRASSAEMKKKVLTSFTETNSKLRIVIATTAFSMGIDCPDIRNVIHYGPPSSVEQYVQETGRAGRDGKPATALLLFGKPGKHVESKVIQYANATVCRRRMLFKHFLFYVEEDYSFSKCKCCDLCALNCDCGHCD